MKVTIDGLPLLGEASIATYLQEMLTHLSREAPENDYSLFFRIYRQTTRRRKNKLIHQNGFTQFNPISWFIPNRFLEWFWVNKNLYFPFTEALMKHPDIFLSTIYLTPVFKKTKSIMIAYDLIPFLYPEFYGADNVALGNRIRTGIDRADALISISERTKKDFIEIMGADPEKVEVIYPDVDERFKKEKNNSKMKEVLAKYKISQPYLLYTGTLGPHKNVETLIRIFRELKRNDKIPHKLVLCGKSKWGPAVIEKARDLIQAGEVLVLDFIPSEEVPHLYDGSELLAFLSLYEGFGLPPLEAMNRGIPVVCSNAGSLPEVVGHAALLCRPKDEKGIYSAIKRILNQPELRKELTDKGFVQAKKFDWKTSIRKINELFQKVKKSEE